MRSSLVPLQHYHLFSQLNFNPKPKHYYQQCHQEVNQEERLEKILVKLLHNLDHPRLDYNSPLDESIDCFERETTLNESELVLQVSLPVVFNRVRLDINFIVFIIAI
jgi:hypothetical protein